MVSLANHAQHGKRLPPLALTEQDGTQFKLFAHLLDLLMSAGLVSINFMLIILLFFFSLFFILLHLLSLFFSLRNHS